MTEEWPPFNFTADNEVSGLSTEIVQEILKRLKQEETLIKVYPWPRAYNIIQHEDNAVLYSMGYSEERAELFKLVGPITSFKIVFIALKKNGIVLEDLESAKKISRIGTLRDTLAEKILIENNFQNLDIFCAGLGNIDKLFHDRVDLICGNDLNIYKVVREEGYDVDNIEVVLEIVSRDLYIAFSKSTLDSIITDWQNVLNSMKEDGTYSKILTKYR